MSDRHVDHVGGSGSHGVPIYRLFGHAAVGVGGLLHHRRVMHLMGLDKFPQIFSLSVAFAILGASVTHSIWRTRGAGAAVTAQGGEQT